MGPTGAICGPRAASSPFSQSRSVGSCAVSSWAQASRAASERITIDFCMGSPPGSRKQKTRLASSKRQLRQRGSPHRIEERARVLGPVDGPGDLEEGAEAALPGLVQLVEQADRARHRLLASLAGPRRAARALEPERAAEP